jgi:hypothetical protein
MARLSQLATNVKGMPQIKTEIDSLRSQLQAKGGSATEKRELRSKLADKLELENETMVLFRTYFHHTLALPAAFQITGSLPLNALIGGVLCFLASLLCFIRDTQPNVVFYVTLFMTLVLLGLYFVCAMLAASETSQCIFS